MALVSLFIIHINSCPIYRTKCICIFSVILVQYFINIPKYNVKHDNKSASSNYVNIPFDSLQRVYHVCRSLYCLSVGNINVTVRRLLLLEPLFFHCVTISYLDTYYPCDLKGMNVFTGITSHRPL